ncbi:MAG: hypothetical protein LC117_06820 [Bacteroidia bacterium]|nr:hypothetical protein [Bacteroidia bacterium]MCZ2277624.1 hypothetical protein [Bacteroidia bacterium]
MKKSTCVDFDLLSARAIRSIELIAQKDNLTRQFIDELYTSARYHDFFNHYSDESANEFIRQYASRKALYTLQGKQLEDEKLENDLKFRTLAEKYFEEILQKKLFDLQCLWRAGKKHLENVLVTRDFLHLEFDIHNIPFLKPVTRYELEIYLDYLNSTETQADHNYKWQDYNQFKSAYDKGMMDQIPEWYRFYDQALGIESLLHYDDIKGNKENSLLARFYENTEANNDFSEQKPELEFNFNTLEFFVHTFEDRNTIRTFTVAERKHPDLDSNKRLLDAFNLLFHTEEEISISGKGNWKELLIDTAGKLYKQKITQSMKEIFTEYSLRINSGIACSAARENSLNNFYASQAEHYRKKIIAARKAKGEPADFNY